MKNMVNIIKSLLSYAIMAAVIIFFFKFIAILSPIPSESMEPTILTHDLVIGSRITAKDIERYDIMIFDAPDEPGVSYIKRVIGLPGETIEVKNGEVYADGHKLDSSYISEEMATNGDGIYEVPDGCYFMMGDNRNNSYDSRFWTNKYVPLENFQAKALITISLKHVALLTYNETAE